MKPHHIRAVDECLNHFLSSPGLPGGGRTVVSTHVSEIGHSCRPICLVTAKLRLGWWVGTIHPPPTPRQSWREREESGGRKCL